MPIRHRFQILFGSSARRRAVCIDSASAAISAMAAKTPYVGMATWPNWKRRGYKILSCKAKPTHGAVERCAGEPVLDGGNSPRLFRHSELADTAHRADLSSRAPCSMNVGSTDVYRYHLLCRPVSMLDASGRWLRLQVTEDTLVANVGEARLSGTSLSCGLPSRRRRAIR